MGPEAGPPRQRRGTVARRLSSHSDSPAPGRRAPAACGGARRGGRGARLGARVAKGVERRRRVELAGARLGPAEGNAILEEGVLLLNAEPARRAVSSRRARECPASSSRSASSRRAAAAGGSPGPPRNTRACFSDARTKALAHVGAAGGGRRATSKGRHQGTSSSWPLKISLAKERVEVGIGFMSGVSISQSTRMLLPCGRIGSLHMNAGWRKTSESSPGAWPVDEPS